MVTSGKINLKDFVQTRPMSTIMESFEEAHRVPPDRRIVLIPDF
jgi:6-hydroxycyclohex-1-ene-1-carbonyl-CoA dehydrogenase